MCGITSSSLSGHTYKITVCITVYKPLALHELKNYHYTSILIPIVWHLRIRHAYVVLITHTLHT